MVEATVRKMSFRQAAAAGALLLLPALSLAPVAASAGDANQMVACAAARADVSAVSLDNLRYGLSQSYFWVTAKVHLTKQDQSVEDYTLTGRADPITRQILPNGGQPGFAYPGFTCTVRFPAITAVENCHSRRNQRTCDIGLQFFGVSAAYAFSLTAERVTMRAAALP